jgi:hypothetical protein
LGGQNQAAALSARFLHFSEQNRTDLDTRRPFRHFGITAKQTSQCRLADGSIPASAMTARLLFRSTYARSQSVEQQRKPRRSNSLRQWAQLIWKPLALFFIGWPSRHR